MDGEAAIGLMESEVRTMNAEIKAHRAETGKSLADVMLECRKWIADEAERRAAADAAEADARAKVVAAEADERAKAGERQFAEFRREARAGRRAMVAAVIVVGLGLAGLIASIGLPLLERVNSLPGIAG